jgi:glycosyltransferase involved in cell wall biosynthesis
MSLRVLHVIPSLDSADGGPSVVFPTILAALAAVGVEVEGATTAVGADGAISGDSSVRRFRRQWRLGKPSMPMARWLARHIDRYDVVHVHGLFSFASEVAAWLARRRRVAYVIRPLGVLNRYGMTERRPWLKRHWLRLVSGPLLRDAAAVHFTSQREADEAAMLGIPMRGVVIPLGVQIPAPGDRRVLLARLPVLLDGRVVLHLSRLDPVKNVEALIDAFAGITADTPDLRLLVCGAGEAGYVASLKSRAETRGVAGRIEWAGEVRGDAKASAFALAELFVLPSHSENFGIAVVEAMAAGVPVVVSNGVPLADRIVEAGAGWSCGTDAASVEAAIRQALGLAVDRQAIGERARELVRAEYSVEAMGWRLRALYEEIVANREPPLAGRPPTWNLRP